MQHRVWISKSGKHLFCSNAGVNSVASYEIGRTDGNAYPRQHDLRTVIIRRCFDIYPDEKHYLTLNNNSRIIIFSYTIDYKDGYSLETEFW